MEKLGDRGDLRAEAWSSTYQENPGKGKQPPRCTPARVHSPSVSFPYICTTKPGLTVTLHPVAVKGSVGAGGRDGTGGREPNPLQLPPRGCSGESVADFQLPPLCPSLWLSQKELSVLLQHSRPGEGDSWLGGQRWGGSLLPLFLSCLGSPLAPNLRRLLAGELEILARTGGGRGSVSQALLLLWGEQGGRSGEGMLHETVGHGVTCPQLMGWQFDSHFHKLYFMSKCTEILWPLFLCPSPSWPPPPRPLPGVCLGPVSVPEAQEGHLEAALA